MKIDFPRLTAYAICLISVSLAYGQNNKAFSILESIAQSFPVESNFRITGNGIYRSDSHLKNPVYLTTFDYTFEFAGNSNSSIIKHQYKRNDKTQDQIRKYIGEAEYVYSPQKKIYIESTLRHATNPETETNWIKSCSLNPYLLVHRLLLLKEQAHYTLRENESEYSIGIKLPNTEQWSMQIDKKSLTCTSLKRSYFHYVYGDVSEEVFWKHYKNKNGVKFPTHVVIFDKGYEQYAIDLQISFEPKVDFTIAADSVEVEKEFKYDNVIVSPDSIVMSKVSDGLFEIILDETNNRLMVAEFDSFLILLEGSYHSKNGDEIIAFLSRKFPQKPIRYSSFSHCHSQYVGFARSLTANGTAIVTTDDNAQFIKQLCEAPFTLRPDKQERVKKKPVFEKLVNDKWKYADGSNSIEVYNIESSHTENYMIFYFPKQKVVFVGDLLWVYEKSRPISGRTLVFYNEIVRLGLDVSKYYISWPLKGWAIKTVVNSEEIILPK